MASAASPARAASILAAAGASYLLWRLLRTKKIASSSPDSDLEVPFSELHKLRDVLYREGAAIVTGVVSAAPAPSSSASHSRVKVAPAVFITA